MDEGMSDGKMPFGFCGLNVDQTIMLAGSTIWQGKPISGITGGKEPWGKSPGTWQSSCSSAGPLQVAFLFSFLVGCGSLIWKAADNTAAGDDGLDPGHSNHISEGPRESIIFFCLFEERKVL